MDVNKDVCQVGKQEALIPEATNICGNNTQTAARIQTRPVQDIGLVLFSYIIRLSHHLTFSLYFGALQLTRGRRA